MKLVKFWHKLKTSIEITAHGSLEVLVNHLELIVHG